MALAALVGCAAGSGFGACAVGFDRAEWFDHAGSILLASYVGCAMIPGSNNYALAEHCGAGADLSGRDYRVVAVGSKKRMISALRAKKRGCAGKHFCVFMSLGREIGDIIRGPAYNVPLH